MLDDPDSRPVRYGAWLEDQTYHIVAVTPDGVEHSRQELPAARRSLDLFAHHMAHDPAVEMVFQAGPRNPLTLITQNHGIDFWLIYPGVVETAFRIADIRPTPWQCAAALARLPAGSWPWARSVMDSSLHPLRMLR